MSILPVSQGKCDQRQDLKLLLAMAASRDWRPFLEDIIQPSDVSEAGVEILAWLKRQYQGNSAQWPPSAESLMAAFPGVEWPKELLRIHNLTPDGYVQTYLTHVSSGRLHALAMRAVALASEPYRPGYSRDQALREILDAAISVRAVGAKGAGVSRFGADRDKLHNNVFSPAGARTRVRFPEGWEQLSATVGSFYPGLYAMFARPKNNKSWTLARIAVYLAFACGLPGVLIDMENTREVATTRLACLVAGQNFGAWMSIQKRLSSEDVGTFTEYELRLIENMKDVLDMIHKESKLYILTMQDLPPGQACLSTEQIERVMGEVGAQWLCADQIHHYTTPDMRRGAGAPEKIMAVAHRLSMMSVPVFATTQENRQEIPRDEKYLDRIVSSNSIFGSDAVAQLCTWLCHVRSEYLCQGGLPYQDTWGASRELRYLQVMTPIFSRNGTIGDRVFRLVDNASGEIFLDPEQGRGLLTSELLFRQKRDGYVPAQKGKKGGSGGSSGAINPSEVF